MKKVKSDGYNQVFGSDDGSEGCGIVSFLGTGTTAQDPLVAFYYENNIARRIVDVIPEEMVAPGFKVNGISDNDAFQSEWTAKKLDAQIIDALCWSRLFGGAAILAMVNDRRSLKSAVGQGALESVRVYDKTQIEIAEKEKNPRNVRFGLPKMYTIKPEEGLEFDVHYSRLHILDGDRIPNKLRKDLNGWGVSVLSPDLVKAIKDYSNCHFLATELLKRKQQTVWKAKDLAALCDDNDGMYAARLRLAQVSENSGVGKPVGIDADDEEYNILNSDITGVPEFMVMKMDRIVELCGIHEIIIKNKNTGGVSASQNTALQTFYKLIERKRKDDLQPILEFLLGFLLNTEEWSVEFEPLSIPSDSEKAKILKDNAESVSKLVTDQVMDTEEARETLDNMNLGLKFKTGSPKLPSREEVKKQQAQEKENEDNS
ncbi:portal protein [Enterobacter phage Ec_L1]|uniref:Portal protein n=1 Tax=Enterobacter phage Ec_L1 TaxID=2070180 RepID=A0A2P0W9Y5_9CAUD|nr:portal protein [Enterobacter phage Ec_L1]AUV57174.1 portal protein [Enterobacter phage Ec_L1]